MLSNVLSIFLDSIESDPSKTTQAAGRDARLKLTHEAKTQACKSCEKAAWISYCVKSKEGYEDLDFQLGKCGGGVILQPNPDSFGLQMPTEAPFFCSVKDDDSGAAGGHTVGLRRAQQVEVNFPRQRGA